MAKPFTHLIQWRRKGYWSPGAKFTSEEEAHAYGLMRVNKGGEFRVVPIERHGELSTDQCLVLMKCMQASPNHWRQHVVYFLEKGGKAPSYLSEADADMLAKMGAEYPLSKMLKLSDTLLRNRLMMADNRERAKVIAQAASDIVALDENPEVMLLDQGAFVQAWIFVPHRSEEEERGRQHDIAAYLAGPPRADAA